MCYNHYYYEPSCVMISIYYVNRVMISVMISVYCVTTSVYLSRLVSIVSWSESTVNMLCKLCKGQCPCVTISVHCVYRIEFGYFIFSSECVLYRLL